MKNLVMSVAKGYGWYDLEPFIVSFQRNCPNADLVLFVDDLSDFTLQCLNSKGGGRTHSVLKRETSFTFIPLCKTHNVRSRSAIKPMIRRE